MKLVPPYRSATVLALLFCAQGALAQTYPAKPVRVIFGVTAGGLQDQLARGIVVDLAALWNQPVIIENRAGSSGIAAAETVARAAPDGYTILQTGNFNFLVNTFLRATPLPYDLEKDFTPAAVLVAANSILVASPRLQAENVRELIALARAKPGLLNYGSFGIGSSAHIDMEAFVTQAGIQVAHVPYKGGAPVLQALMTDEVQLSMTGLTAAIPLIKQGRIKALAYGGERRSAQFPDLPTVSEAGLAGYTSTSWWCWLTPAGTPPAIVNKIAADTARVLAAPAFREKFIDAAGHELVAGSGDKLKAMLAEDKKVFAARIKPLNLKLE